MRKFKTDLATDPSSFVDEQLLSSLPLAFLLGEDEKSSIHWAVDSWLWGRVCIKAGFLICVMQDLAGLPELFSPGMLVRCVVSSLGITEKGKKSVKLSLNPKNVNKVLSAEALKPSMVRIWFREGESAAGLLPALPSLLGSVPSPFIFSLTVTHRGGCFREGALDTYWKLKTWESNHFTLERSKGKQVKDWLVGGRKPPRSLSWGLADGEEFLEVPFLPTLLHRSSFFKGRLAFVGNAGGLLSKSNRQSRRGNLSIVCANEQQTTNSLHLKLVLAQSLQVQ